MASVRAKIKEDLTALEGLYAKYDSLKSARDKQLDKHLREFNEATKPINERFDAKMLPLKTRIDELESSVCTGFEVSREKDGSFKLGKVESEGLIAEPVSNQSAREVEARTFYDSTPPAKRQMVWSCLKVLIGQAEKLVGKEALDKLAKVKTTWSVQIRRK